MLSDEEKKAIESFKEENNNDLSRFDDFNSYTQFKVKRDKIIIDLIEKQSKEIEELKEENKEIREWKYVIDNPIDLKKLSELDIIKIFGKSYIAKDLIKAEIEELQEDIKYSANPLSIDNSKFGIKVLQSLLEEE